MRTVGNIQNLKNNTVISELVTLAAKHTGFHAEWVKDESSDGSSGVVKTKESSDDAVNRFWQEFDRLKEIITEPLNEPILPDDHPLVQGYVYVANGKPTIFIDGERQSVGTWKQMRIKDVPVVTEVRRCDIEGRKLRLPPEKQKVGSLGSALLETNSTNTSKNKKHRKPRNSNKIKKVS